MIKRCYQKTDISFKNYGARGIGVCDKWYSSYDAFVSDMGRRPSRKHSIERKDNDGNYDRFNCVWATKKEQARNTRANVLLTINGVTKCLPEWADILGMSPATLHTRVRKGWSDARTLTEKPSSYIKILTFKGRTQTLQSWSKELGIGHTTLRQRIRLGWPTDRVLSKQPWTRKTA